MASLVAAILIPPRHLEITDLASFLELSELKLGLVEEGAVDRLINRVSTLFII